MQNVIDFFEAHRGRYRHRDRFFNPDFRSIPIPIPTPKRNLGSGSSGLGPLTKDSSWSKKLLWFTS